MDGLLPFVAKNIIYVRMVENTKGLPVPVGPAKPLEHPHMIPQVYVAIVDALCPEFARSIQKTIMQNIEACYNENKMHPLFNSNLPRGLLCKHYGYASREDKHPAKEHVQFAGPECSEAFDRLSLHVYTFYLHLQNKQAELVEDSVIAVSKSAAVPPGSAQGEGVISSIAHESDGDDEGPSTNVAVEEGKGDDGHEEKEIEDTDMSEPTHLGNAAPVERVNDEDGRVVAAAVGVPAEKKRKRAEAESSHSENLHYIELLHEELKKSRTENEKMRTDVLSKLSDISLVVKGMAAHFGYRGD